MSPSTIGLHQSMDSAGVVMHFLTCHGTIVRVERSTQRLIHAAAWPERDIAADWQMTLPPGGLAAPVANPADPRIVVHPAHMRRLVHIRREADFLCAEANSGELRFNRPAAGLWETFLLLTQGELASLREMLSHGWVQAGADAACVPVLSGDYVLQIGDTRIDLRQNIPIVSQGDSAFIADGMQTALYRAASVQAGREIVLKRREGAAQAPPVADLAAFEATPTARLTLQFGPEYGYLPLAVSRADEDWMNKRWSQAGERRLGKRQNAVKLVREQDKFVLLGRRQEGLIFDEGGASNETGYMFDNVPVGATGPVTREGDHFFISAARLRDAPRLAGPHAVFYGAHISNYYHWVIDALLPLHVMRPYLPPGTRLLIPATLQGFREGEQASRHVDHMAALREWGLGDLPAIEIDAPLCHVEEVYWLDECFIEHMPAHLVRAARADVLARLPPAGPPRGIYIRRDSTRYVDNAAQIEQVMTNNGFTIHAMEGMTPRAQMELFRDANFVVAPHGAALANLLFCAPGTKIIEFAPECEFRPLFAQISDKLDLAHAVLPCPTHDGGFHGRMSVDVDKFRILLRQLQMRG